MISISKYCLENSEPTISDALFCEETIGKHFQNKGLAK